MAPLRFLPAHLLSLALAAPLALPAAGELDPAFAPVAGITSEVAVTAEGKVLGLGDYDGSGVTLVRFNADGRVDPELPRRSMSSTRRFAISGCWPTGASWSAAASSAVSRPARP